MYLSIETATPPPTPGRYGALMGITKVFAPFCVQGGGGFFVFCCITFAHEVGD